jgi:hypothetical protein
MNRHENRFVHLLQYFVGEAETGQEVSIPRKARRLDLVCRFAEPPSFFGALRGDCAQRTVLFEHESQPLSWHAIASAWVGQAWLHWERVRPRQRKSGSVLCNFLDAQRPPLAVVVADSIGEPPNRAVPGLAPTRWQGVWATGELVDGGLYVLDTSMVRPDEGFAFWSWLGRAPTDAIAARRLDALYHDPNLPIQDLDLLREAIMNGQLYVSVPEKETTYQRIRRELRVELRDELRDEVRDEVGRCELLALAANAMPEHLDELRQIEDIVELRRVIQAKVVKAFQR